MEVRVELPAIGAVFVLVDTIAGEVACLFDGEMLVRFSHAHDCVFNRPVAPRQAAGETTLCLDPRAQALGHRLCEALGHRLGRWPEPFDRDEALYLVGIDPRITRRDIASERVADESDGRKPTLMNELREVVDIARHAVVAVLRPLAIAMPTQIRRDDVPAIAQSPRYPVPIARMIAAAMDQDERGRIRVSPIEIMQP